MEFTAMLCALFAIFAAISAVFYLFVPFWIKRIMDTLTEIKALVATQNELLVSPSWEMIEHAIEEKDNKV